MSVNKTMVIPGLTNGTTYRVKIKAVHGNGEVEISNTLPGTPRTITTAPTIQRIDAGDKTITIHFFEPSNTGGLTITNYEYSLDNGNTWLTRYPVSVDTPIAVSDLMNNTTYMVKIRALTSLGAGDTQLTAVSATPTATTTQILTAPSAPTILSTNPQTTNSDAVNIEVRHTIPTSDGGSPILGYEYSLNGEEYVFVDPEIQFDTTTSNYVGVFLLEGLFYGASYSLVVRAQNTIGYSTDSAAKKFTPSVVPPAPTAQSSPVFGNGAVTVNYAVTNNYLGNSPVINYKYRINSGAWITRTPASTGMPWTISGLTNGNTYSLDFSAINAVGDSAASAPISGYPLTTPGAPTLTGYKVTVSNGTYTLKVFYTLVNDGGAQITSFLYSLDNGVSWSSNTFTLFNTGVSGASIELYGDAQGGQITPAATHKVKLKFVNEAGSGAPSTNVLSCAIATVPEAPAQIDVLEPDEGIRALIHPPASVNGSRITNYEYSLDAGKTWITRTPASTYEYLLIPISFVADPSRDISLQVRAVNAIGAGPAAVAASTISSVGLPPPVNLLAWHPVYECENNIDTNNNNIIGSSTLTITGVRILFANIHPDLTLEALPAQYSVDGGSWSTKRYTINTSSIIDPQLGVLYYVDIPHALSDRADIRLRLHNSYGYGVESESLTVIITEISTTIPSPSSGGYDYCGNEPDINKQAALPVIGAAWTYNGTDY